MPYWAPKTVKTIWTPVSKAQDLCQGCAIEPLDRWSRFSRVLTSPRRTHRGAVQNAVENEVAAILGSSENREGLRSDTAMPGAQRNGAERWSSPVGIKNSALAETATSRRAVRPVWPPRRARSRLRTIRRATSPSIARLRRTAAGPLWCRRLPSAARRIRKSA